MLKGMQLLPGILPLLRFIYQKSSPELRVELMGLHFPNPVGLAAGLDKNAECVPALMSLGFGWIELGTVTPKPQPGNPQKRLFRVDHLRALINRMGFPSAGVDTFLENLRSKNSKTGLVLGKKRAVIVGINIGKNKNTPNETAYQDYVEAFSAVYASADYIAINVSSPNTPQLRELQNEESLDKLLRKLKEEQLMLAKTRDVYVPLVVKISPDLNEEELNSIVRLARQYKIDAIIAGNTTIDRPGMDDELLATEMGGVSGPPLKEKSTAVIRILYNQLRGDIPIIGVGGIENADDAWEKLVAGADLIQVYTGFIYQGPALAKRICRGLKKRIANSGCNDLVDAVAKARSGVRLMR